MARFHCITAAAFDARRRFSPPILACHYRDISHDCAIARLPLSLHIIEEHFMSPAVTLDDFYIRVLFWSIPPYCYTIRFKSGRMMRGWPPNIYVTSSIFRLLLHTIPHNVSKRVAVLMPRELIKRLPARVIIKMMRRRLIFATMMTRCFRMNIDDDHFRDDATMVTPSSYRMRRANISIAHRNARAHEVGHARSV